MHANIYLNFDGDCEEAFRFYVKVCGGSIEMMSTFAGSPAEAQTPPEWQKKILHARIKLGDTIIMGSDAPPGRFHNPAGFSVSLTLDTPEQAERVFASFSEKGEVRMAMAASFFAERFGMVVDRFGTPWIIICERAVA